MRLISRVFALSLCAVTAGSMAASTAQPTSREQILREVKDDLFLGRLDITNERIDDLEKWLAESETRIRYLEEQNVQLWSTVAEMDRRMQSAGLR